jgi:hypothetical protein
LETGLAGGKFGTLPTTNSHGCEGECDHYSFLLATTELHAQDTPVPQLSIQVARKVPLARPFRISGMAIKPEDFRNFSTQFWALSVEKREVFAGNNL